MAPIEAIFEGSWGEEENFILKPGESKRIHREGTFLQVRCNRLDLGGQVFLRDETTTLKIPDRGRGMEIPLSEIAQAVARINISADPKSPTEIRIHGEPVGIVRFVAPSI